MAISPDPNDTPDGQLRESRRERNMEVYCPAGRSSSARVHGKERGRAPHVFSGRFNRDFHSEISRTFTNAFLDGSRAPEKSGGVYGGACSEIQPAGSLCLAAASGRDLRRRECVRSELFAKAESEHELA